MGLFNMFKKKEQINQEQNLKKSNFVNLWNQMTVKSINEDDQLYLPYRFFKVAAETSNFKANLSTEISNIVDEQSAKILFNDQHYFEILAYVYTRVDFYLFVHKKSYRQETSEPLLKTLCGVFNGAFSNVNSILNERIVMYSDLLQKKAPINEIHFILVELLKRANSSGGLKSIEIGKFPLTLTGITEDLIIKEKLLFLETKALKEFLEDFK